MLTSAVVGFVEPTSYSLDESLSWALTSVLKRRQSLQFRDGDETIGAVIGIAPLLQPVGLVLDEQSAFLMMMRVMIETGPDFRADAGEHYVVQTADSNPRAEIVSCSATVRTARLAQIPFLSLSSGIHPSDKSRQAVGVYIERLVGQLWDTEPVNWTTHNLHLASNGSFLTARTILSNGLVGGVVRFSAGSISVRSGIAPLVVNYRPNWAKAGQTGRRSEVLASIEDCSSTSYSNTSGGDSGSGCTDCGGSGSGSDG